MRQSFLDLSHMLSSDIVLSNENKKAVTMLENLSHKMVIIIGSKKSGKTTLVKKFSKIHKAKIIKSSSELKFEKNKLIYFIDKNLSEIVPELLFHFIQNIITNKSYLYIFSEENSNMSLGLKDLDSRISLFTKIMIEEPDTDLMKILLKKHLSFKSITLKDNLIDELVYLIERTYESVYKCPNYINRLLYKNNHNINLRLIKEFYNGI